MRLVELVVLVLLAEVDRHRNDYGKLDPARWLVNRQLRRRWWRSQAYPYWNWWGPSSRSAELAMPSTTTVEEAQAWLATWLQKGAETP